jgi:uncharacterized protein (UPF0210 family)
MLNRREFAGAMAAVPLTGLIHPRQSASAVRVRAITAGVTLPDLTDLRGVETALQFLKVAEEQFKASGYEVQTRRVAIAYPATPTDPASFVAVDKLVTAAGAVLAVGPVNAAAGSASALPGWLDQLIKNTKGTSASYDILSAGQPDRGLSMAAAEAILRLSTTLPQGLANFRFAAAANIPAGTPFFPVARHEGAPAFAIGLESPALITEAVRDASPRDLRSRMIARFNDELGKAEGVAVKVAKDTGRHYLGIDTSPAPGMDRSIGEAVEAVSGRPFGDTATLSACALITDVIRHLDVKMVGYCGLMLPILEDPVLAKRAAEGRVSLQQVLLYSSVCGTGLDVIAIPGDTPPARLADAITDVAALSAKWTKPLAARLLPVSGARRGDRVHFDDPFLTDSIALSID